MVIVNDLRAGKQNERKGHQLFLRVKLTDLGADEQKNSYATGVLPPHGKSCSFLPQLPPTAERLVTPLVVCSREVVVTRIDPLYLCMIVRGD